MWGDIKPMNTFPLFVLQPAGIAMEAFGNLALKRSGLDTKIPGPVVRMIRIYSSSLFFSKHFLYLQTTSHAVVYSLPSLFHSVYSKF